MGTHNNPIKNYEISEFESSILDGELVIFPMENQWLNLTELDTIQSHAIFDLDIAKKLFRLMRARPQLRVGLRRMGGRGKWTYICFISIDQLGLQRVHLEYLTCDKCKSNVWSAYPLAYDLFIGTYSADDLYTRAKSLPMVNCPICGAKLPRASIFAFMEEAEDHHKRKGS